MAHPMRTAKITPTAKNVPITSPGLRRNEDWFITLPLEKDPVGFAIACVYAMVDPSEFVEIPTLVRRGAVVENSPFDEFMSVTDTGVEKVDVGSALGSVTATEVACAGDLELL